MNKKKQRILLLATLVVINIAAVIIASFAVSFTGGDLIFSPVIYIVPLMVIVLSNMITVQMFSSMRNGNKKRYTTGLVVGAAQAVSMYSFILTFSTLALISIVLFFAITLVLIMLEAWTIFKQIESDEGLIN